MLKGNYYISSFFWSTLAKILNAVLGFVSVPLLLGLYGKAEYGILAIATSCNAYMHLLDLGMNTGAVKFFSQWKAEGKQTLIYRVARTNISFYLIIACINVIGLLALGLWGRSLFSVTDAQFQQLRECLYIIALFSVFSWVTTAFNQLLIADKQMGFTMQVQCVQTLLKGLLVAIVVMNRLSLSTYFFYLTLILALLIVPYAIKCLQGKLIDTLKPGGYWKDFKVVLIFSLSIFALSLFQTTAIQSRPILLSIFAANGAEVVAEFRILEVIPSLIIMIGGTFSSIFLPKTAELVARKNQTEIERFAYKWTTLTTILANTLCFPFILSAKEILSAYVGAAYSNLSVWLVLWCVTVLIQIHTTPGNSLVLAYGKTKLLVIMTAVTCVVSMLINVSVCPYWGVGSAVIGYFVYVAIIIGMYYVAFYKKLLQLSRWKMCKSFLQPTLIALLSAVAVYLLPLEDNLFGIENGRIAYIATFLLKSVLWFVPYVILLFGFKVISLKELKKE